MRRLAFTNRTLLALLTAFIVGCNLGNAAEQAKVRITTWNLEWFPNGSAHDARRPPTAAATTLKRDLAVRHEVNLV